MTDKTTAMTELPEPFALSVSVHEGETYVECMLYQKHPNEKQRLYTADQMRAYALAALQAAPPAAAGVSDVIAMVRERYRGTKWGKAAECIFDAVDEAILAQRPQAVPMTDEQRQRVFAAAEHRTLAFDNVSWRDAIVDAVEAHHDITAQGAQGEQG